MKIRNDFVTNSSSSSFVIATKDEINYGTLMNAFNVGDNSPLYSVAKQLSKYIINDVREIKAEQFLEEYNWYTKEEKSIENYNYFYSGSASNESDEIEAILCDMSLMYEDENIMIVKESGY